MDNDWREICQIAVNSPSYNTLPTPASALAFDTQQELLWVGNDYGRITSFHGPELQKYSSYRGHPSDEGGTVKQLLFHERGVISVAPRSIHLSNRRGLTQWHLANDATVDLCCMTFIGKENGQILVAGCQNTMSKVDVEKGLIIETISTDYHYTAMKFWKYICAATRTGEINLLDADNLRIVKTLTTNNISISDMDARNNYLVSCGWANRPQGGPMLAGLANVFDLRAMVQLTPIPFHSGAAFVQTHPKLSTTCIIGAQNGQIQVVDIMNSTHVVIRQVGVSNFMSKLVLAPSGEAMAVADVDGLVRLWGSPTRVQFTEHSVQVPEWADEAAPVKFMEIDDQQPLNSIGMPYYREHLLSVWSNAQVYDVGSPAPRIDPVVAKTLGTHDNVRWMPNPKNIRRNQAEKTRMPEANNTTIIAPKFLSEKARAPENSQDQDRQINDLQEALLDAALSDSTKEDVPIIYRNVEIKYSKFGVDDFDFEYYNKTPYSGLETHIPNSYTNSLLQLMRFTPIVRNLALHHTATSCIAEACLLCELGFLFDTLEKAKGSSCQATNFCKTFSSMPKASNLSLLEDTSQGNNLSLTEMLQGACRFILDHAADDFRGMFPQNSVFDESVMLDTFSSIRCIHCHNDVIRPSAGYATDLVYPAITSTHRMRQQIPTFSQVLKNSMELLGQTRGWCDKCHRYQHLATRKTVRFVPDVLMINAALKSEEAKQYWAIPGWLPDTIGVLLENGKFFCFEGEDLRLHLQKGIHVIKVYDLVGIVADINSAEHQKSHLVSLINVGLSDREQTEPKNWYLFNDFLVRKLSTEHAMTFMPSWKMPSVLAFQVSSARHGLDDTWKDSLDTSLLYHNWSINNIISPECHLLDPNSEVPGKDTCVAIDTEFVELKDAEFGMNPEGERMIIRPNRLGLARVSVLRGNGEYEGVPFINDYITVREDIFDYLTKFSGVEKGDLDPRYSPHNLVPLKVAYKKIWLLVNLGCIFIGHGLKKDFRIVNIYVPKSQVLDTVELFRVPKERALSLRFLAWHLLKEDIQQNNHDSIEDARTALRIYRKYQEFKDAGILETILENTYVVGARYKFKPPGEASASSQSTSSSKREFNSSLDSSSTVTGISSGGSGGSGALCVPGLMAGAGDGRDTPETLSRNHSGRGTPASSSTSWRPSSTTTSSWRQQAAAVEQVQQQADHHQQEYSDSTNTSPFR